MVNVGALSRGGRDDIDYLRHNLEVVQSYYWHSVGPFVVEMLTGAGREWEVGVDDSSLPRDSLFMKSEQRRG